MSLPSSFVRVEWQVARSYEHPSDRRDRASHFTTPEGAARQVRSIASWPDHQRLTGLWRTVGYNERGLVWEAITVGELPPVPPEVEEWFRAQEEARVLMSQHGDTVRAQPGNGAQDDNAT